MLLLFQEDKQDNKDVVLNCAVPPELPKGVRVSPVFWTFWRFAAERQEVFFRRMAGLAQPWTDDRILQEYRFTNVFRASDRVSQFLIRNVICAGPQTAAELFFRIILFKLFNRIDTWELLSSELGGEIAYESYSFHRYDSILSRALDNGFRIYSAAYIMPSGKMGDRKHRHHLRLLEMMMAAGVPNRLQQSPSMKRAFEVLRSYASIGDFLAYQFVTDLNYSELLNFTEMEFVKAGPGAKDGIRKCFYEQGSLSPEDLIRWMVDTQEAQFESLELTFRSLWGRRLQLIDCQNVLCEVDKYSRNAHPEFQGISGRTRIKQRFRPTGGNLMYFYPPKWGINKNVHLLGADWGKSLGRAISAAD